MHRFAFALVAVFVFACSREPTPAAATPTAKPPSIVGLPVTLKVKQRAMDAIPGSSDRVSISIGDITGGQVTVTVAPKPASAGSTALLGPSAMKVGDTQRFHHDEAEYELELTKLDNALIGTDVATFALRAAPTAAPKLTEAQKIEKLIESVGALHGATFIRNGDEHAASDAATHLRRKRDAGGKDNATAEQFIENAGTRSSLSGKDYEIRFADGRTVRLADFLREQLAKLDAS